MSSKKRKISELYEQDDVLYNQDYFIHAICNGEKETLIQNLPDQANYIDYYSLLTFLIHQNDIEMIKFVIQKGNIDCSWNNSFLLHWACDQGHSSLLNHLLHRSDIKINSNRHLQLACKNGHFEIVRILLENGFVQGDLSDLEITTDRRDIEILIKTYATNHHYFKSYVQK